MVKNLNKTPARATCALLAGVVMICLNSPCRASDNVSAAIQKGTELLDEERFQDAIPYFDQAIKAKPDLHTSYELRAKTYAELGDYKKAIEDYTKAIELYPSANANYSARANLYLQSKQYKAAVEDLSKVVASSHDPYAHYMRGWAYVMLGEHQKAVADYTQFLSGCQDQNKKADGYINRANSLFELHQDDKALNDINTASKLVEEERKEDGDSRGTNQGGDGRAGLIVADYARAYFKSGLVYSSLGRYNNAVDSYSKAIAINADLPDYYKVRAEAYDKLGQHQKAQDDLSKAATISAKLSAQKTAATTPGGPDSARTAVDLDTERFEQHLSILEKKMFGKSFIDDLIPERLARIEEKMLGKAQSGNFKHRLDALMLKAGE
jgi:tetratricopeptide (TPR) repeat protein